MHVAKDQSESEPPRLQLVPDVPADARADGTSGDLREAMAEGLEELRAAFADDALSAAFAADFPAMRRAFTGGWQAT